MGAVVQITGGLTKNSARNALPLRVPYLRVANVYANELRLDEITEIGCTEAEYRRTLLQPGDLLIVEGNGSLDQIGRVAMWDGEHPGCAHQNHLIRARMG
ncbi:restriction endonuclease subunit S, partial [Salmonella enterica subsp. enterica serovar Enteritidis]|nr:restriction endonuclease subunit S [Salmonella enterica subsp. enterica serovar Enteritidis]